MLNWLKEFNHLVKYTVDVCQIPSITYAVIVDNALVEINSCTLDSYSPYGAENKIFRIGSNSKAMACTILASLEKQSKLSLDDNVTNYLPNFRMGTEELTHKVRVMDLLTHSTGISKNTSSLMCYLGYPKQFIINSFQHLAPIKPFRSSFQYNDGLYIVAGELIEKVTQVANKHYFSQHLFSPLGMDKTHTSLDTLYSPAVAVPHVEFQGKTLPISQSPFADTLGIGGNVYSTALDLVKWLLFNLKITTTDDDETIHYQRMFDPQIKISQAKLTTILSDRVKTDSYAMGWYRVHIKENLVFEHMGAFAGYASYLSFSPQLKSGIVLLANKSDIWHPLEALRLNFYELITGNPYTNFSQFIRTQAEQFSTSLSKVLNSYQRKKLAPEIRNIRRKYVNAVYGDICIESDNEKTFLTIGPHNVPVRLDYAGNLRFKFIDEHFNYGAVFKLITLTLSKNQREAILQIFMDNRFGQLVLIDTQKFFINEN